MKNRDGGRWKGVVDVLSSPVIRSSLVSVEIPLVSTLRVTFSVFLRPFPVVKRTLRTQPSTYSGFFL